MTGPSGSLHILSDSQPGSCAQDVTLTVEGYHSRMSLRECARIAIESYLHKMGNHPVDNLLAIVMEEVEPMLLEAVMQRARGNQSEASKMLGLSRGTLRKKLLQYQIRE